MVTTALNIRVVEAVIMGIEYHAAAPRFQSTDQCWACMCRASSGHRLIWWGVRYRFAMNPMLHRTICSI